MINDKLLAELKAILKMAQIDPNSRYLTAKQIETLYGVPSKTILNRSALPTKNPRYLPSVRLKGGRKKYFEKKVIERLFCLSNNAKTGGQS